MECVFALIGYAFLTVLSAVGVIWGWEERRSWWGQPLTVMCGLLILFAAWRAYATTQSMCL